MPFDEKGQRPFGLMFQELQLPRLKSARSELGAITSAFSYNGRACANC